jgi:hypothetical protein
MREFEPKSDFPDDNPSKPGQYELFTKVIKAGKKTYFFDVRQSKSSDYYLIITESAKKTDDNGRSFYKKHKIFVSQEDLLNFREGLNNVIVFLESVADNPLDLNRSREWKNSEQPHEISARSTISDFDDLAHDESKAL